jgi:hypothetical protein
MARLEGERKELPRAFPAHRASRPKGGGWRSAVIYTALANCRAHGLEPYGYFKGVLEILPRATNWQLDCLTPAAWAAGEHLPVMQAVA